jgi:hypothetical protein
MLTDLDIATGIKKNVVTLDITVNNVLCVQVFKATASLSNVNSWRSGVVALLVLPQDRS